MIKPIICLLAALIVSSSTLASQPVDGTGEVISVMATFSAMQGDATNLLIRAGPGASVMQQREECCKICTTGKACGNSCINRDYQCHQPPGCACDG